uniref:Alternative protein FKBP5 n=1 Tax=Homo sapiens TaxID=9606 RepID=L0R859_HUMAN|nr:alternative protein FKBP5 [Homo sapiens]
MPRPSEASQRGKFLAAGLRPPLRTSHSLWAERKPDRDRDYEATIPSPVCARSPRGAGSHAAEG